MKNKLLGGAALLMAAFSLNEANATSCAVPPTCAQLGYTMKKADCGDYPVMRCPFALTDDNQVFCEGTVKIVALPILYDDGQVTKQLLSGPTAPKPIGVVFDETNKLAMSLMDYGLVMPWAHKECDIPDLENCTDYSEVLNCSVDGRANTDKIMAYRSDCGGASAAEACHGYQPASCTKNFCKQGKWFLPSMRDMYNIYQQKELINATLSSIGGIGLSPTGYWTSTERDSGAAWMQATFMDFHFANGKSAELFVRPVIKY